MIYTDLTKKAMRIAFDAHKDQVDKAGLPYIFHPFHLAEQMDTEEEVIVALLHDVVEDTDITLDDLRAFGFSEQIIDALSILSHADGIPYPRYICNIKYSGNDLVKKVKLVDLRHNSDETRYNEIGEKDKERLEKYNKAIGVLSGTDDYWSYYLNDDTGAIVRFNSTNITQTMAANSTQWVSIPPDNSYMREIWLGQGNNCLTQTTEKAANKLIEQWQG